MKKFNEYTDAELIEMARRQYVISGGNVQIDDDAECLPDKSGCWVAAWLWIRSTDED
jgi:hypothetical protein